MTIKTISVDAASIVPAALNALSDVVGGPVDGDLLIWSDADQKWLSTNISDVINKGYAPDQNDILWWDDTLQEWSAAPITMEDLISGNSPEDLSLLNYNISTAEWEPITLDDLFLSLDVYDKAETDAAIATATAAITAATLGVYTTPEVDQKISSIAGSLSSSAPVKDILNTPPSSGVNAGDHYIIGTAPTGDWATHVGEVAKWSGTAWVYSKPTTNEEHLVLDEGVTYAYTAGVGIAPGTWAKKTKGLSQLEDCTDLAAATNGQVPQWNSTTSKWVPVDQPVPSPIIFLGTGAWDSKLVASKADNYGMAADTVPDPKVWTPKPGDQYIDLATGVVTAFT